jgi:hypothetical protein
VLPSASVDPRRYAVAWNGLLYPLRGVGRAADLARDVRSAAELITYLRTTGGVVNRSGLAMPEADTVGTSMLFGIRAVLLYRFGRGDLADSVRRELSGHYDPDLDLGTGPYAQLALEWLWTRFERALGAHARGDDALAYAEFRALAPAARAVAADQSPGAPLARGDAADGPIAFLAQLPALIADQTRRARTASASAPAGDSASVSARIEALDRLSAPQETPDGAPAYPFSPEVRALVAAGADAFEPLIAALAQDERLTRTLSYHNEHTRARAVVPVAQVVLSALSRLCGVPLEGRWPDDRAALIARARAAWHAHNNAPPPPPEPTRGEPREL